MRARLTSMQRTNTASQAQKVASSLKCGCFRQDWAVSAALQSWVLTLCVLPVPLRFTRIFLLHRDVGFWTRLHITASLHNDTNEESTVQHGYTSAGLHNSLRRRETRLHQSTKCALFPESQQSDGPKGGSSKKPPREVHTAPSFPGENISTAKSYLSLTYPLVGKSLRSCRPRVARIRPCGLILLPQRETCIWR